MPRYRLTLEYDGATFVGWQRQDNGPSVQQAVEEAIRRLTGAAATVVGAGRTDAGVHALGQVAHVDLARSFEPRTIRDAVNFHLKPAPVSVLAVEAVGDDFHARFSACRRRYRYLIVNRPAPLAIDAGRAWWIRAQLDRKGMADAARLLVGRHDFSSFRSSMCQAPSATKTLESLTVEADGDLIRIEAAARSFLHNQVRIIVGSLKRVGDGGWPVERIAHALIARDRRTAGPTAPAHGLYLVGVDYRREGAVAGRSPSLLQEDGHRADRIAQPDIESDDGGGGHRWDRKRGAGDEPRIDEDEADGKEP
jgi:tRNA pseudouridine38-40 synthase